ncbi:MAG: hypothetical protein Q4G21_10235 [Dermabacter sp.]|nr:hypothetical protein [Dermabacter sp.]
MSDGEIIDGAGARASGYTSLALRDIPVPDYCDVVIVPTRGVRETDPEVWASAIFSHDNATLASRGAKALRDEAIRLFDLVPPPAKDRVVSEVVGAEALIIDDTPSLRVRIGVAVEPGGDLVRVTTAVKYRSIRGRLTFGPRRLMHAAAVHTLARRAPVTIRRRAQIAPPSAPRTIEAGSLPGRARIEAPRTGDSSAQRRSGSGD